MNQELVIPRKCYEEGITKEIYSKYNIEDSIEYSESGHWVVISGFERRFISLMRPILELEIGPIDYWVNGFTREDSDIYFVLFRSNVFFRKSLQYDESDIFGIKG
ncbi:hypothetical protein FG386_003542 [Cryptosporidium ryanae]|uniref:uncharacterized protein n=1 Tax=Cryptosporidium ryanae TaxID=515981 RepID=UPI00351A71EA|nr:hypothetical protein FG386_003542 [Cryptosporidium ryanae]